jgi:hypothetical protein
MTDDDLPEETRNARHLKHQKPKLIRTYMGFLDKGTGGTQCQVDILIQVTITASCHVRVTLVTNVHRDRFRRAERHSIQKNMIHHTAKNLLSRESKPIRKFEVLKCPPGCSEAAAGVDDEAWLDDNFLACMAASAASRAAARLCFCRSSSSWQEMTQVPANTLLLPAFTRQHSLRGPHLMHQRC